MKKSLASGVGLAAALIALFGSGSANAVDEYKGLTYEKAAQQIYQSGGGPIISSREGSYLPTEQCLVVGSRKSTFLDSSGRAGNYRVLLDINCNDVSALNGHPGNSVTSESGKEVQKAKKAAADLNADFEKATAAGKTPACFTTDGATRWCVKMCNESKSCSAELSQALGL